MKSLKQISFIFMILLCNRSLKACGNTDVFVKYPNSYFVETGSYVGDGIQMAIDAGFKKIYSIELKEMFYENCCLRFAFYPFVKLFLGDSSKVLPVVLDEIDAPATFWLDGHYSGSDTVKGKTNTPLLEELDHIAKHHINTHTILIDDIRQFGTREMDFISLQEVIEKIQSMNPDYEFLFEDGYSKGDILVAIVKNQKE